MTKRPTLSRKLLLESPVRAADGAGGFSESWTPLGAIWAEVLPRSGRENGDLSRIGHKITVRAAPQGAPSRPKPTQRFRDGTRVFSIDAVTEMDADARFLICTTTEEAGA